MSFRVGDEFKQDLRHVRYASSIYEKLDLFFLFCVEIDNKSITGKDDIVREDENLKLCIWNGHWTKKRFHKNAYTHIHFRTIFKITRTKFVYIFSKRKFSRTILKREHFCFMWVCSLVGYGLFDGEMVIVSSRRKKKRIWEICCLRWESIEFSWPFSCIQWAELIVSTIDFKNI